MLVFLINFESSLNSPSVPQSSSTNLESSSKDTTNSNQAKKLNADGRLRWDSDQVHELSSQQILNKWLRVRENYLRYKMKNSPRKQICENIYLEFEKAGITHRTPSSIERRIIQMEQDHRKVKIWLATEGASLSEEAQRAHINGQWPSYFELETSISSYGSNEFTIKKPIPPEITPATSQPRISFALETPNATEILESHDSASNYSDSGSDNGMNVLIRNCDGILFFARRSVCQLN